MKLKFDANLDFQIEAINSVVNLFEGLPNQQFFNEINLNPTIGQQEFDSLGVSNKLSIDEDLLLKNLQEIQDNNMIYKSKSIFSKYLNNDYDFPNFSVEMETGTGKTYVYLRTIFELSKKYGFKKYIIVVPSIAIREGVMSSINIIKDHFKTLYNNPPFDHFIYTSADLSKVRQFATSNEIQIMIINIQAFQKEAIDDENINENKRKVINIIHQEQDRMSGRKPIDFIKSSNPIVIIDEPQSVDNTEKSKKAINTLNPLFCLRYSATHINPYNLIYKLDPIKAYDLRLVKQIEVSSIFTGEDYNRPYLRLDSIEYDEGSMRPHAKVTIIDIIKSTPKYKTIKLIQGSNISKYTSKEGYDNYIVSNICAEKGIEHIEFSNGTFLELKEEKDSMHDEIMKTQIFQTVEEHFKKEKKYKDKNIKVLSLFFIDKVNNYRIYDDNGNPNKGKIANWFEEAYQHYSEKPMYKNLIPFSVDAVHDGYFSVDKKKGQIITLKDTSGNTRSDEETFELIMKDKERLLSIDEPLRFIFSHSALKEGWDNPNIFQICSLREMGTERERRQTIGRGLRLPVNNDGERIFDNNINKLTVIASETFEEYAKGLQEDFEKDIGGDFKFGRINKNAFSRLIDSKTDKHIGQEQSEIIWDKLKEKGYINDKGDITPTFEPTSADFDLEVSSEFEDIKLAIKDEMKRFIFKNRIVNARERKKLRYNKRIELNEDFKILWNKINKKTRYKTEFKTDDLVTKAIEKIKNMDKIEKIKIYIQKQDLDLDKSGVVQGKILDIKAKETETIIPLPDIITYLQNETELTRSTIVRILIGANRFEDFKNNPQTFMTEVAKLISRSLNEMIIDGIKYERIAGQEYEMRLFENDEIEEYLSRLYEVKNINDRTPYDYIYIDSEGELEIAKKLDESGNVKFFCKLPRWFLVPTPLGNYNPDWAIVTEQDEKIYLVRETKSTHDRDGRRLFENKKVDCGKAHFQALNVNFKIANNIYEVISK